MQAVRRLQPLAMAVHTARRHVRNDRQPAGLDRGTLRQLPLQSGFEIAAALVHVELTPSNSPVYLVPGLMTLGTCPACPDVIRGEETQVFGALRALWHRRRAVRPAWNTFQVDKCHRCSQIDGFRTYMTGEIFMALERSHNPRPTDRTGPSESGDSFAAGVTAGAKAGAPGDLMHRVFSAQNAVPYRRTHPERCRELPFRPPDRGRTERLPSTKMINRFTSSLARH